MTEEKIKAPLVESVVYTKNGITYFPHYQNNKIFVGPGYPKCNTTHYSENQLLSAGAEKNTMFLWPRGTTGLVIGGRA